MTNSSMYISPWHTNQLFAGGDGGLWVRTNSGATWTHLNTYSLVYRVTGGPDGTIYYSGMNGSSKLIQKITSTNWSNTASYVVTDLHSAYTSGIGDNGQALITTTVLQDGRLIVSDNENYTRISANQGSTFSTMTFTYAPGIPVPQWASYPNFAWRCTSLVQDPVHTNNWYRGAGYGPLCTTNSGTNWQYIPNGIGEVVTYKIGFHPTDSNRVYIPCADLGGAVVTDGGVSGNTVSMLHQFFTSDVIQCSHRGLSCKTNGYNRVIFAGWEELNSRPRVYATINDGTSWYNPGAAGLPTGSNNMKIIDAMDSRDNPDDFIVICGSSSGTNMGGVYRTVNAGTNFTQCNWYPATSVNLTSYTDMFLDRDATNANIRYMFSTVAYPSGTAGVNSGGGLFISYDRGQNWTQLSGYTGGLIANDWSDWIGKMAADHGVSGHVWVALSTSASSCCHNGLAYSANYGTNFSAVGGFTNALTVDALSNNVVVFGQMAGDTYCKIYYSSNNGAIWNEITRTNYEFGSCLYLALNPYRPGQVWISTQERSVGIFTPGAAFSISGQPQSQPATYGSNVTMSVTAAGGTAPYSYQWYFTNSPLAQATNASLTLTNIHATNAGSYNVVVSSPFFGSLASSNATLTFAKAVPVLTWTNPASITYGTALSSVQLNATASVQGAFVYNPLASYVLAAGNNQNLSVTFTPADMTDYSNATATVSINVQPATPVITWTNPAPITSGTALDSGQLNATANTPGAFAYIPPTATVLAAGNNQTLSTTFTPTDTTNYTSATAAVTINVQQPPPSIGSVSLSGTNLVINGANLTGDSNSHYIILSSPDMALPVAQWTPVATNGFNADGTFSFTNGITALQPAMYYTFIVTNN